MSFYSYAVCHLCKTESENIYRCKNCKVTHYCSRDHQKEDWSTHKDICKVITKLKPLLHFQGGGPVEFNKHKMMTAIMWQSHLDRALDTSEHEMWMFPRVCAVCYSSEVDIVCYKCSSVAYCSAEHQQIHATQHEGFCLKLKMCLEMHQKVYTEELNWERISFEFKKEVTQLPENIFEVVKIIQYKNKVNYWKKAIDMILMTEFFCSAINIVHALEQSKFVDKRIGKKPKLIIHATTTEIIENTTWGVLFEFLAHWIHNLKWVKIFIFVSTPAEPPRLSFSHTTCASCRKKKFNAAVLFMEGEYQDFIATIPPPDLVVMFNTPIPDVGTHEWSESIPKFLIYKEVPIILTTYTEENMNKVIEKFPSTWIQYYFTPQENMYRSLRPFRNSEEGFDPVIYRNSYVAIIAKK